MSAPMKSLGGGAIVDPPQKSCNRALAAHQWCAIVLAGLTNVEN